MSTLERFLLVSAIVLFIFVFYKWLMRFLHRNEIQGSYPYVFPFEDEYLEGQQELKIDLPSKSKVLASLFDSDGKEILKITDDEYNKGIHSILFDCNNLTPGAYEIKIRFSNQKSRIQILVGDNKKAP